MLQRALGVEERAQRALGGLQQPGVREDLEAGRREFEQGETASGSGLRAPYGLPPR